MCVISNVGDHFRKQWEPLIPPKDNSGIIGTQNWMFPEITRDEFDQLRREVLEMKELLIKAKIIDEALGTPDCENDRDWETSNFEFL